MTHCKDCKGPCTRTIELNSKAPKVVQRLFGNIEEEIKAVSKMLKFQDMQKARFIHALKRNNAKVDNRSEEMNELKESQLAEIEEAKIRLAAVNAEIKRKESLIKSYDANAENQPPGFMGENDDGCSESLFQTPAPPTLSDSLLSLFPRPGTGAPGFITSTPIPPQTQTGNHTLEGDFMKLRTPAAWYDPHDPGMMGRREEVKANRRSSDDGPRVKVKSPAGKTSFNRSRAEVKSPMKTIVEWDMNKTEAMKSPVEQALDKLLAYDSPVKIAKNLNVPYHDRRRKKNRANPYPSIFNNFKFFTAMYK